MGNFMMILAEIIFIVPTVAATVFLLVVPLMVVMVTALLSLARSLHLLDQYRTRVHNRHNPELEEIDWTKVRLLRRIVSDQEAEQRRLRQA